MFSFYEDPTKFGDDVGEVGALHAHERCVFCVSTTMEGFPCDIGPDGQLWVGVECAGLGSTFLGEYTLIVREPDR